MAIGKRQLVLAALVVALGAAVYLNWQFAGNDQLLATDAVNSGKELGQAQLVNGSAESPLSSMPETSGASSSGEESTGSEASSSTEGSQPSASGSDYFAQVRLDRQKARDVAVDTLERVLDDAKSSEEAKKDAVNQAAVLAQNVLKENNIESLVKAKGFDDCVAFIQNGECNVVVMVQESSPANAVVIKDIVKGQTDLSADKIKIVENKA